MPAPDPESAATNRHSTIFVDDIAPRRGAPVTASDETLIGTAGAVLTEPKTADPQWITVVTDATRGLNIIVPLIGARWESQRLRVACTGEQIATAPPAGTVDALFPNDERVLLTHYERDDATNADQQ